MLSCSPGLLSHLFLSLIVLAHYKQVFCQVCLLEFSIIVNLGLEALGYPLFIPSVSLLIVCPNRLIRVRRDPLEPP